MASTPPNPPPTSGAQTTTPKTASLPSAFKAPTQDILTAMILPTTSNLLPTPQELESIAKAWTALGIPESAITSHALALVNFCFDSGSSRYTVVNGTSPTAGIQLSTLASIVREHSSLRRFCRYFAPVIWNVRVDRQAPPASWMSWNFKEAHKYAAFDFFDGVLNPASMQPPGGLIRQPTPDECVANATSRSISLFETAMSENRLATTSTHLTHGRLNDGNPRVQFLPGPE